MYFLRDNVTLNDIEVLGEKCSSVNKMIENLMESVLQLSRIECRLTDFIQTIRNAIVYDFTSIFREYNIDVVINCIINDIINISIKVIENDTKDVVLVLSVKFTCIYDDFYNSDVYYVDDYNGKIMKISNIRVYDIKNSIIASGYPFSNDITSRNITFKDIRRAIRLGSSASCSGHDNFLSGIVVNFDITCTHYFLIQFQRYHFAQIVSSQSKMHNLLNLIEDRERFHCVDKEIINKFYNLAAKYLELNEDESSNPQELKDLYLQLLSNTPLGMKISMRVSTNLLQLKNMYSQRYNHKLNDWKEFCEFIKKLPLMNEIITN